MASSPPKDECRCILKLEHRFLQAAFDGNLRLLKWLAKELDNGEGIAKTCAAVKDSQGKTALRIAADEGHNDVCKYLIEELKLDVNVKDAVGEFPLLRAVRRGRFHTAVYLIEVGANVNQSAVTGVTPLHAAVGQGLTEMVLMLISKGADLEAKSNCGTPLAYATNLGRKEAVKILLANNANPNSVWGSFITPLLHSIMATSFECMELLLKAGADPNTGSHYVTPLGFAASRGKTETVKRLLKAGADPNIVDSCGLKFTPLEYAAAAGDEDGVTILFAVTTVLPSIPDWSVSGIMKHFKCLETQNQVQTRRKEVFQLTKSKGDDAFKRKDYWNALYWYSVAMYAYPTDATTVLANQSLCWTRLNDGYSALSMAEACIKFRPDWVKAHYREGAAWKQLQIYRQAARSFSHALELEPDNEELQQAFEEAVEATMENSCLLDEPCTHSFDFIP